MIHKICVALVALFVLQAMCLAKDSSPITDDTLSDQVRVNLASDKVVGVLPLQVSVAQGVVTLSGAVEQKSQRAKAEKVARKVKGVKQVVNKIEIKPRTSGR